MTPFLVALVSDVENYISVMMKDAVFKIRRRMSDEVHMAHKMRSKLPLPSYWQNTQTQCIPYAAYSWLAAAMRQI